VGNLRVSADLEETQELLGRVVAALLEQGSIPIVLGGGHETAYGHYLGYVAAGRPVGIVNIDAHLDVRPWQQGLGHSGSPFRQAMKHPAAPLPGSRYVCLGAQPHATSRQHWRYAVLAGAVVRWRSELQPSLGHHLALECERLAAEGCQVYVSLDADVVRAADVPGVSAPNVAGLQGDEVLAALRLAGELPQVSSFDLVEINPACDRDGQSARWAAVAVWNVLMGLACRAACAKPKA
jgi:formiminoglutamase